MKRVVLIAILLVGLAVPAWAGSDEGVAAYERGDYETAFREFLPLAEQGDADAQFSLGFMYYFGDRQSFDPGAIPLDDAEAAKWMRLAAQQGQADAQAYLGLMYANGEGVPQDDVQAYKWFTLAVANSDSKEFGEGAQAVLQSRNVLEATMTPDQIAEAQKLVREWMENRELMLLAELGDASKASANSKELKTFDLTCTDIGFIPNPEGFKKSFRPALGLEIREGTTFNAEIYFDFNEQGKALGGRMNIYHGYAKSSEPVNRDIYFVSGSGFRITFVTHELAHGITTYSFMPKFGLMTKIFMQFQIDDNVEEGKVPGRENVVVEQYFCTRNASQN